MLALIEALPSDYTPMLACPTGALADAGRQLGVPVQLIDGTDASLRFHAVHTTRALYHAGSTTRELARIAKEVKPDLVHANSIRTGLIAATATTRARVPTIAHVHDRLPQGRLPSFVLKRMVRAVDGLFACSNYVAEPLWALKPSTPVRVVLNPVDVTRFDPAKVSREEARARLGLKETTAVLVVVAQIMPWKAQDDAIRILAEVKREHPDVCLLIVGSPKFTSRAGRWDTQAFASGLDRLISSLGVRDEVRLLGEREDIPEVLRAADIALVPSWEEPFGICVIEAMAMELPVLATSVGGPREVITDGEDGLLLPPRDPTAWAAVASRLLRESEERAAIGRAARKRVIDQMNVSNYVERILAGYADSLQQP